MNIFDIILLIILLIFGIEGYRRGFFRETLSIVGMILILFLSFILMNPLGNILLQTFPIISLHLINVEIQSLNILFYQIIAFLIIAIILCIIWNLILNITGILGKIVGLDKFLHLPLKILGFIIGVASGYVILFLILLVTSIPINNKVSAYKDSKVKDYIINNKIMMTTHVKKISNSINDIYNLTYKIENDNNRLKNSNIYNAEVMDIMLNNKIISVDVVDKLIQKNKIRNYDKLNNVLDKYREVS